MHASQIPLLLSASLAVMAAGIKSPIPGYSVFTPRWDVQAHPDGEYVPLNGTVEEVIHQLRQINPDYDDHFALGRPEPVESADGALEKRNVEFAHTVCNNRRLTSTGKTIEGARYLNRVKGKPSNGAGPGNCGRVSCGYYVAIWWCNEAPHPRELSSFREISDGVSAILRDCHKPTGQVSGEAYHKDNWNVIVQYEHC